MTALELIEELEALAAKATPRPWEFTGGQGLDGCDTVGGDDNCVVVMDNHPHQAEPVTSQNQALCAALVNALPQLAAAVRAMTSQVAQRGTLAEQVSDNQVWERITRGDIAARDRQIERLKCSAEAAEGRVAELQGRVERAEAYADAVQARTEAEILRKLIAELAERMQKADQPAIAKILIESMDGGAL